MNKGKSFFWIVVFLGCARFSFAQSDNFDLGEISILATRTSMLVSDISQGVTVITQEDIRRSTATSLPDVIGAQSGIFVTNYLGNPKGVKVDVRGFGETSISNLLVLVDGRRTNQVDLSGSDWGQISLDSVERIEILKGASTVLYGDNASAGVVNIVTKKGYQGKGTPVKVEGEAGSFGYRKGSFTAQGTAKQLDYFLNFSHQNKQGYRDNNNYWANDLLGNLKICPTDKVSVDLSSGYHLDQYGMPGALFASDIATLGRKASTHLEDRGWTSDV
ncbi:MAG: TonB-dependent receptor plug domain-containing protein, partial [Candidatus Omnitrophota bacterium]